MALAHVVAVVLALQAAAPSAPQPPQVPAPMPPGVHELFEKQQAEEAARKAAARRKASPPRPCPFLAADAKPIFAVKGTSQRVPQAMYPLGFSKQGRFAWLETVRGMEAVGHTWYLHVVNLDNDRSLVNRGFDVSKGGVPAMCDAAAPTITRLLEQQGIAFGTAPALAPGDDAKAPPTVEVVAGRPIEEKSRTPYRVLLRGPEGSKQVGVLWRVEVSSGEYPRAKPVIVGLLRSPFEPRVAVVAMQKVTGIEAVEYMDVTVLGGRLDRGWHKESP